MTDAGSKCLPQISINDAYWRRATPYYSKADVLSLVGYTERTARRAL